MATEKMKTLNIKGKNYVTVNERLKAFRTLPDYKGWTLRTIAHELTHDVCTMEAQILDPTGRIVANGFAHELRTQPGSMVNATSHIENCETSAWGRALGNLGIGIDESICSAQELLVAVGMQNSQPAQAEVAQSPAPTQAPAQEQKKKYTQEELEDIYNSLSERELAEYNDACRQMQGAAERKQIVNIYNRFIDATFAPLLLDYGNKIIKEKGF